MAESEESRKVKGIDCINEKETFELLYKRGGEFLQDLNHSYDSLSRKNTTLLGFLFTALFALLATFSQAAESLWIEGLIFFNISLLVFCCYWLTKNIKSVKFKPLGSDLRIMFEHPESPLNKEYSDSTEAYCALKQSALNQIKRTSIANVNVIKTIGERINLVITLLTIDVFISLFILILFRAIT